MNPYFLNSFRGKADNGMKDGKKLETVDIVLYNPVIKQVKRSFV